MAKSVMTFGNNDDLKLKAEQLIDEAYIRGYEDGNKIHEKVRNDDIGYGYQSGLNDAWECGRRITNETSVVLSKIFGEVDVSAVFQLYTPQEAMQKIKDYERRQKLAEQAKRGKEHRDEIEKMLEGKNTEDDYVDAIVKVRVPKWQIGEKVNLYFKDTMSMDGICEADK